jgi:hypothetical protein
MTGNAAGGPVVVLSYPHAGAQLLGDALAANPGLACTTGTGVLPLCHSALAAWQAMEGRNAPPSALAVRSVRAMLDGMVTVARARSGAARWCEVAFASREAAETFLLIFPATTFVCLHRALPSLVSEAARLYPWGLGGTPFWPYAGPHLGNNLATIAAYWVASTEPLLEFEARHADRTLRMRYEDLAADAGRMADVVCGFAGLAPTGPRLAGISSPAASPAGIDLADSLPRQLPGQLRSRIDALNARLGYPDLPAQDAGEPRPPVRAHR